MTTGTATRWDPSLYATHASFVPALGAAVLDLLAPQSGERVLDLGCGNGSLLAHLRGEVELERDHRGLRPQLEAVIGELADLREPTFDPHGRIGELGLADRELGLGAIIAGPRAGRERDEQQPVVHRGPPR